MTQNRGYLQYLRSDNLLILETIIPLAPLADLSHFVTTSASLVFNKFWWPCLSFLLNNSPASPVISRKPGVCLGSVSQRCREEQVATSLGEFKVTAQRLSHRSPGVRLGLGHTCSAGLCPALSGVMCTVLFLVKNMSYCLPLFHHSFVHLAILFCKYVSVFL